MPLAELTGDRKLAGARLCLDEHARQGLHFCIIPGLAAGCVVVGVGTLPGEERASP